MTDVQEMLGKVDHTQLKAICTWEDIEKLCREAVRYHTASVCIPPCYVERVREAFGGQVTICTVIGFPLGYQVTAAKICEAREAIAQGCDEVDMVINLTDVKNGRYDLVEEEIRQVKAVCGEHILKVIVETC